MEPKFIKEILEAAIMTAEEPMSVARLAKLFVDTNDETIKLTHQEIKKLLIEIEQEYATRPVELKELASGYTFRVKKEYAPWISKIWQERPPRYSRALLETLALIIYRQPITRGEIENVRGVSVSSHIIKTLLDRGWIKEVGQKEVPGKPSLFATTKEFLDYFNLKSLSELPALSEIQDLDKVDTQLAKQLELAIEPEFEENIQ